jgi:thiamine-phosphate pyrophosphorylase
MSIGEYDLSLYGILDPKRARGRDLAGLAAQAIEGGAGFLQLRDKDGATRQMIDTARRIVGVARPRGVPLVINDRVDVALAAAADGVHIGDDDMAPADARALLGPDAIIGVTIHSVTEAAAAPADIAAYYGIGPFYGTASKDSSNQPIGAAGFETILRALRARHAGCRVVGIAGIEAHNAAPVIDAGAEGVAVISALFMADDVTAAACDLAMSIADAKRRLGL